MARRGSPLTVAVGRRIEAARVAAGFETMRALAKHLGVDEQRYRRWEAGEVQAPYEMVVAIAEATGMSCDFLLRNITHAQLQRIPTLRSKSA